MPIRPEYKWLYPIDWRELSFEIRFKRAGGRCEQCGRPHGKRVRHLGDGRWWDEEAGRWRDGRGRVVRHRPHALPCDEPVLAVTTVVLATAHLDHDPSNNAGRNLRALCQRCHLLHDREEHQRQRWLTYRLRYALGDLFLGRYCR